MVLDSPLFLTKVECPLCGTVNEFETIRVGAYSEGERETDFCPSVIKWRNPKYQRYNPLLFFTATCAGCHYTREFNAKYREWFKDNNFRTYRLKSIKEKHLAELSEADSFIKLVGGMLDNEKYPDETAILKLILAIYDELLYEHPSNLDLGRFYLRVAWLFRQCRQDGGEIAETAGVKRYTDIETGLDDLGRWISGLGRNLEYLEQAVEGSETSDQESEKSPHQALQPLISELRDLENSLAGTFAKIENTFDEINSIPPENGPAAFGPAFYSHSSFDEFLIKLARMWDGVPRSEKEAMRRAAKYYIRAFEQGKEIGTGNQAIQAAYLIGELSRRTGDNDTARQYFNTTIKMGQEFINEIRGDRNRTALARKLLELAIKQGKKNLAEAK